MPGFGEEITLSYDAKTSGSIEKFQFIITSGVIRELYGDLTQVTKYADSMDTLESELTDKKTGKKISAVKTGDSLTITSGKISKTLNTKGTDWYQSVFQLKNFILSSGKSRKYWVISSLSFEKEIGKPDDISIVQFTAKKVKEETVIFRDRKVEAVKVMVSLQNIPPLLWKSYYWYRKSDGMFLSSEETRGMPGTPKTHIKLTQIN